MEERAGAPVSISILLWVYVALLLIDSLFLARWVGLVAFPGETRTVSGIRSALAGQAAYYRRLAEQYHVDENEGIEKSLARFAASAKMAANPEQGRRILRQGAELEERIRDVAGQSIRPQVMEILQSDPNISAYLGETELIVVSEGDEVSISATDVTLQFAPETPEKLSVISGLQAEPLFFRLTTGGELLPLTEKDLHATEALLRERRYQLERALAEAVRRAGGQEISGPGVTVAASDAPGGFLWVEVVHERDIREIVNSLFASGAKAVQVGTERLGAASWVRCVGPVVVVNGKAVAANPITIQAIGDPERLSDSLQGIKTEFSYTGKRLEISPVSELTLVPYQRFASVP